MSGSESASLATQHKLELRDLKRLRKGGKNGWVVLLVFGVATLLAWIFVLGARPEGTASIRAHPSSESDWVVWYLDREQSLSNFLWYFSIPPEHWLFTTFSDAILGSGAGIAGSGNSMSMARGLFLAIHTGLLHLLFVILCCWRAWLAYVLWIWVHKIVDRGVYQGDNLLGQMGNGRLFYSGARAGLFNLADNGAPDIQVRGLACPPEAPPEAVEASALFQILKRYAAVSETNRTLIAYLLADSRIPGFASGMNEDRVIERAFDGCSLIELSEVAVERALYVHAHYSQGAYDDDSFYEEIEEAGRSGKLSVDDYASRLLTGFHRVLTDSHRDALRKFTPSQIATIVLSLEASKVLAYTFEGGRWIRASAFPELCARAVLHSVVAYGREFDYYQRENVRQALIYGSRFSLLGPVRLPLSMSMPARAARQWVELLLSEPQELASNIDEVELVGIVAEVYQEWSARFTEALQRGDPAVLEGACVGPSAVVFMPVRRLLAQMREILPQEWIDRMGELVAAVSQKQKLVMMSGELNADGGEVKSIPAYQRILPALSYSERKTIAEEFALSEEDVRDWCALRVVFNSHGWLARRVGNRSVPESSIIFSVLKIDHPQFPPNEKGKSGIEAVVPLRGSRLETRIGKGWASLFPEASMAKLAETRREFQMFLVGKKKESGVEDEGNSDESDESSGASEAEGDLSGRRF